jgi:hypothetical protein
MGCRRTHAELGRSLDELPLASMLRRACALHLLAPVVAVWLLIQPPAPADSGYGASRPPLHELVRANRIPRRLAIIERLRPAWPVQVFQDQPSLGVRVRRGGVALNVEDVKDHAHRWDRVAALEQTFADQREVKVARTMTAWRNE